MPHPFAIGAGAVLAIYALMQVNRPPISIPTQTEISSPVTTSAIKPKTTVNWPPMQGLDDGHDSFTASYGNPVTTIVPRSPSDASRSRSTKPVEQRAGADTEFLKEVAKHPQGKISVDGKKIQAEWGSEGSASKPETPPARSAAPEPISTAPATQQEKVIYVDRRQVVIKKVYVTRHARKRVIKRRPAARRPTYYAYAAAPEPCPPSTPNWWGYSR